MANRQERRETDETDSTCPASAPRLWIYFVESGDGGPIKIGYARNVEYRVSNLQTGNPVRLRLLGKIAVDDAQRTEEALHEHFRPHLIRGEWYRPVGELAKLANDVGLTSMIEFMRALEPSRPARDPVDDEIADRVRAWLDGHRPKDWDRGAFVWRGKIRRPRTTQT